MIWRRGKRAADAAREAREREKQARREARERKRQEREEFEARLAERSEAFAAVAPYSATVEADCDGVKFLVDTQDAGIGRQLFAAGRRPEFAVLERALALLAQAGHAVDTRRSVFVDVGANIGTATMAALAWHNFGRAIACEPWPRSAELLRLSAVRNGLEDRLMVVGEAISDHVGELRLQLEPSSPGLNPIGTAQDGGADFLAVAATTLDDVLARLGVDASEIGLLWIDVQGHEANVLKGAGRLLARRCPIVFEYWPAALRAEGTLDAVAATLAGYENIVELRHARTRDGQIAATDLEAVTEWLDGLPKQAHTDLLAF